jgi:hypothetical protein
VFDMQAFEQAAPEGQIRFISLVTLRTARGRRRYDSVPIVGGIDLVWATPAT